MVTSSSHLSGSAHSTVDHPGVHQPTRSSRQHSPNGPPPGRSSTAAVVPRPASTPSNEQQRPPSSSQQQQQQSAGPSVVSRYVLPTYRQANSSSSLAGAPSSSSIPHQHQSMSSNPAIHPLNASLPDILHSHMVPQIPRLRQNQRRHGGGAGPDHRHGRERHRSDGDASRHRHAHHGRGERRRTQSSSSHTHDSCSCKEPCFKCVVTFTSFRWVLVVLSILGVCCVVSGIVLAALHAAGSSFLFLAVMFIGLGILLVIVVGVGWKCTPRGHEPLHALFHIGQFGRGGSRERHRRRRHRHRDGNWFGGVFYPEFQYRRPPPSYAASMQDYQNQGLQELSRTHPNASSSSRHERTDSLPGSPPPSYHSRTSTIHSGMNITIQGDSLPNSRPPTYRSRAPSRRPSLPRHDSPSPQQDLNTSSPSTTIDRQDDHLHVAAVGESATEAAATGGDSISEHQALATSVTVSYSPTAQMATLQHQTQMSQQEGHDELNNTSSSSSINTTQILPTVSSSHVIPSQPGADEGEESVAVVTTNQNDPDSVVAVVVDNHSFPNQQITGVGRTSTNTGSSSSTIVVITNQPVSSSSSSSSTLPQTAAAVTTTTTPSSTSFISRTSQHQHQQPAIGGGSGAGNFESDVQQLEQALESLDGTEDGGIDNLGASISSGSMDHYDTHL